MKTKAVYVIVSGVGDIFFEQAWVSAWSLKHYNPTMTVEFVVDQNTYTNIYSTYRKSALAIIDKIVKVDTPQNYNNKERSRWLKTSLRKHVTGDYLFIDTDTIVCDSLEEIDDFTSDVMMEYDGHCEFSKLYEREIVLEIIFSIIGKKLAIKDYYNSGVMYVKDTPIAHEMYEKWHELWCCSVQKGIPTDQKSLAVVLNEKNCVTRMSGIYNCMIRYTIRYLHKAKIIHFFNGYWYQDCLNPFFGKQVYEKIKKLGYIDIETQEMILDCKSLFVVPSLTIAEEELEIHNSKAYELLKSAYINSSFYYALLVKLSDIQLKLLSPLHQFMKWSKKRIRTIV